MIPITSPSSINAPSTTRDAIDLSAILSSSWPHVCAQLFLNWITVCLDRTGSTQKSALFTGLLVCMLVLLEFLLGGVGFVGIVCRGVLVLLKFLLGGVDFVGFSVGGCWFCWNFCWGVLVLLEFLLGVLVL